MLTAMHAKPLAAILVAAFLLSSCVVPHHSVVVETNSQGVPVHAAGTMDDGQYTVVRGDTLYSIAFRTGEDYHDLARWNHIGSPYVIHPGQKLRTTAPSPQASTPAATATPPSAPVFKPVKPAPSAPTPAPVPKPVPHQTAAKVASAVTTTVPVAGEVASRPHDAVSTKAVPPAPTHSAGGVSWRWPADGALASGFNPRDAIPGIEIAGKAGDPVHAAADGVVVYSGNGLVGYGELIIIKHNETYLSAYGHNRKRLVHEGERVRAGQVIAEMGSSGASRNELEFQVRKNGKPVDPQQYLPSR